MNGNHTQSGKVNGIPSHFRHFLQADCISRIMNIMLFVSNV